MSNPDTITIGCQSDDNYLPHTAAMLHSLWAHHREQTVEVCLLHDRGLSQRGKDKMQRFVEGLGFGLRWLLVDEAKTAEFSGGYHIPKVVWYRVFLPDLAADVDRLLFLDGDVIVNDNLMPLWETALDDHIFAAVTNAVPERFAGRAAELGLPGPESYFNTGIALWNLKQMREEGFVAQVVRYCRDNPDKIDWLDQDAFNALFHERRLRLHPRWNCQNGIFYNSWGTQLFAEKDVEEAVTNPALVHFEGGDWGKPWHLLSPHPFKRLYIQHRRKTPWPFYLPDGLSMRNLLKRYLPERLRAIVRRGLRDKHSAR